MNAFSIHPVADIFPSMTEAAFAELVADIEAHGQREPIVLWRGQVLDGRHRLRACQQLGRSPLFREIADSEDDPNTWVISLNLHRRHLSESQRAAVAARLETLEQGRPRKDANLHVIPVKREDAANLLKVSPRSVAHAAKVLQDGTPELVAALDRGEVAVSTAADISRLPAEEQREVLTRSPDEIRAIAREVKSRLHEAGVAGSSAVRLFDQFVAEKGLSGIEQCAVAEVIKAETPPLPTPSEARRIATEGAPGLMVLGSDGRYHTAPVDPEEEARLERWLRLREGLEPLGTLPFPASEALASIPPYQQRNVTEWLARALPFLTEFNQLWSHAHA